MDGNYRSSRNWSLSSSTWGRLWACEARKVTVRWLLFLAVSDSHQSDSECGEVQYQDPSRKEVKEL